MLSKILNGKYPKYVTLLSFLVIGTALYSPFINNHFTYDDFLFVSLIEENIPVNPLLGFWAVDMQDMEIFKSIWWMDDDAEGTFFRPIPTLVFTAAFNIWGRESAMPLHLFSILLHCINAFLVYTVLSRLSKKHAVSLLAGFIYLICVHHVLNVGWISTNTDLLAVFFMILSIYGYITYRERNKISALVFSILMQLLAFGCKETASITTAAIILYELIYVPVKVESPIKILFSNWKHWIPGFVLTLIFLIFYKMGGFGINSILYYDPFLKPMAFISNLFVGCPLMFLGLLSLLPFSFPAFIPGLLALFVLTGIVLLIILIFVLIPYRKDRNIIFCFCLFVISILPQLSADATERQLYFPYTIGSFIISFLIFQIPFLKKKYSVETPEPVKYIVQGFSYYILISSVVLTFLLMLYYPNSYSKSTLKPENYTLEVKELADKKKTEKIILLNTPGSMCILYMNDIYRYYEGKYNDLYILYGGNGRIWLNKSSDSTITLKTDTKGWLTNFFAKLPRTIPLVDKERVYNNKVFSVKIVEISPDKEDILEAQFMFKNSLASSGIMILCFDGTEFKEMKLNEIKPGEWIFIGDTSDILKYLM